MQRFAIQDIALDRSCQGQSGCLHRWRKLVRAGLEAEHLLGQRPSPAAGFRGGLARRLSVLIGVGALLGVA